MVVFLSFPCAPYQNRVLDCLEVDLSEFAFNACHIELKDTHVEDTLINALMGTKLTKIHNKSILAHFCGAHQISPFCT